MTTAIATADADIALTRRWAELYRLKGFQVLPSRPDEKRPMVRFADYWESPAPADLMERFETPNVQVILGRRWRLLVIDLDGPEARAQWPRMGRCPRTWVTHSGGDGEHWWFRLPADYPRPLPKAVLWRPDPTRPRTKGEPAIERLCDRSLVMAPPSIHPGTGERYRFRAGLSPKSIPLPADCPAWVLRLAPCDHALRVAPPREARAFPRRAPAPPSGRAFDRREVLDSIHDKVGLARQWGVRVAGSPSPKGWVPCHAIDREDNHPSAAIHQDSGSYCDLGSGLRLSLFDLGVTLGVYADFKEAIADLGANHHAR